MLAALLQPPHAVADDDFIKCADRAGAVAAAYAMQNHFPARAAYFLIDFFKPGLREYSPRLQGVQGNPRQQLKGAFK